MVLFSKRKETRQEDEDQTTGEANGEAPRGQPYLSGRIVTSRASTATTDPLTPRHADQLDVVGPDHGSVLLQTDAAMATVGAMTPPRADAMRHSAFDAEVGIPYILEHHALGIEKRAVEGDG
jgi:hypothetical protein